MTEVTLIETVSADSLTQLLQDAGCRVNRSEQNAVVQLLSASQGVGYAVRFGNRAPNKEGEFLDFTFSCALRIQGELPGGWPSAGTPAAVLPGCRCRASSW